MRLPPKTIDDAHARSDVDSSVWAFHHTLGGKQNQAAPGNHTHDDLGVVPVGGMIEYLAPETAPLPKRWLDCDGSILNKTKYPKLANLFGTWFNIAGDPGSVCRLPDLRKRVPVGWASGQNGVGVSDGQTNLSNRNINHSHTVSPTNHQGQSNTTTGGTAARITSIAGVLGADGSHNHGGTTGSTTQSEFPFLVVRFIVYAGQ